MNATWKNTKTGKTITGQWVYRKSGDYFFISLDKKEPISGQNIEFRTYCDSPEWKNWKLLDNTKKT